MVASEASTGRNVPGVTTNTVRITIPAALPRLAESVFIERHDEWEAGERRYFSESSMQEPKTMTDPAIVIEERVRLPELIAAQAKTSDPTELSPAAHPMDVSNRKNKTLCHRPTSVNRPGDNPPAPTETPQLPEIEQGRDGLTSALSPPKH